ncbi:hypothetical protein [Saccharopolyspora taberi]|uniref:DUF222 domain-containing protein n=1 Tax=Saccharopolyspora taberi TaxID=60895 RepID=A0ABN3VDM9_9PSEU
MNADELVAELMTGLRSEVAIADPGAKPGDHGDDQRLRREALARVRAALEAEALTAEAAARGVESAAAEAVWLGASLADLSAVTGRSRQAARKRWPDLGAIRRRRKWLSYHVDDVFYMVELLVDRADRIAPDAAEGFEAAVRELSAAFERVKADFAEERAAEQTAARWVAMDELVDVRLREVIAKAGTPSDGDGGFAVHGAGGVLGYYDHATAAEQD